MKQSTAPQFPIGPGFLSKTLAIVNPGETYYLCIMNSGGWAGSTPGSFSFTITTQFD